MMREGRTDMDIRAERTLKMLRDAFEELLGEKSLDDITVSDICNRSTIRRNTFYRHFEDKQAFAGWYLESMTRDFRAKVAQAGQEPDLRTYVRTMHMMLIQFMVDHEKILRHNINDSTLTLNMDTLVNHIAAGLIERLEQEDKASGRRSGPPAQFIGMFYSGGMMHTLRWWLQPGKPISARKLEEYATDYVMGYYAS